MFGESPSGITSNAYIIEDTKSAIILTHPSYTAKLDGLLAGFDTKPEYFCLNDDQIHSYPTDDCGVCVEAEDLAYIIYILMVKIFNERDI